MDALDGSVLIMVIVDINAMSGLVDYLSIAAMVGGLMQSSLGSCQLQPLSIAGQDISLRNRTMLFGLNFRCSV